MLPVCSGFQDGNCNWTRDVYKVLTLEAERPRKAPPCCYADIGAFAGGLLMGMGMLFIVCDRSAEAQRRERV